MELREFAERVLFARSLQEKLLRPDSITDERPGPAIVTPQMPGRPPELGFKPQHSGKSDIPGLHDLERSAERGRLLHFFANHELLATELMALVLLRFPEAPRAFRRAVLGTLQDEQEHTRWYLRRMAQCGVEFGELPVSGYFWRAVSGMQTPADYVTGLSLTFEQANLDFARFYARGFARVGDLESSQLLERIYQDEIGHVACGLKWFRRWKEPNESDWEAFQRQLHFPLSAQRAKGPEFNVEGRLAAGLDPQFINQLKVYAKSKGRTPTVFVFNPLAEEYIALGRAFTPNLHHRKLKVDLENLPQFLCRQDDIVLVEQGPSPGFLDELSQAGFAIPEFAELDKGFIGEESKLRERKLGGLRPWAWSPDSVELLSPLLANSTAGPHKAEDYYNDGLSRLYSKEWSAELLKRILAEERNGSNDREVETSWLCTQNEVATVASTMQQALEQIQRIRDRGHHQVVLKKGIGLAGQDAIRLLEPELLDSQKKWMVQALEKGQRLIIEPWLERVADFSVQLELSQTGLKLVGYAGLLNDWKGRYLGSWAGPDFRRRLCVDLPRLFPQTPGISNRVCDFYSRVFFSLQTELRRIAYFGPVGIDAFVYRTSAGECRLKPIVEINPRYTMGRLMLELMRVVAPGSTGKFRLITKRMVHKDGFENFASWAEAFCKRGPLVRVGEPIAKLRSGALCLTDPNRAHVCLGTLEVSGQRT